MTNLTDTTIRTAAGLMTISMLLVALGALPAASAVQTQDTHVASFSASPPFINLNRTTTLTLNVSSLYGGGNDNYRVTIYKPSGGVLTTGWFNLSAVGSTSLLLGNATQGLNATVTEVGAYILELEHQNGNAFTFAATFTLQTTDKLLIITEFANASNPYTDEHNCPVAEHFQRGDEIIARAYVKYLSTGEAITGANSPTMTGNITGTLFNETKALNGARQPFWRAAWFIPWDKPLGTYPFNVTASDGLGNTGTGLSPPTGIFGSLKIIPSVLQTSVWTVNASSGATVAGFYPGDVVKIHVYPFYDLHFAHNFNYTNTNRTNAGSVATPGVGQEYRLGPDRGGVVTAAIGSGAYNASAGKFADNVANLTLAFDEALGHWTGTWEVPATVTKGDLQVRASALDAAPTANGGFASTAFSTLVRPEPVKEIVKEVLTETKTEYVNQTIEVEKPGGLGPLAYGLIAGALVVGAGGAYAFARGKMGGGKKDDEDWE